MATLLLAVLMVAAAATACVNSSTPGKIVKKTNTGLLDIGDVFEFGTYEQDNNPETVEKISWIVLDREDEKALVMSVAGLDVVQYNEKGGDTTWETSTARKWLNETFLSEAFDERQAKAVLTTTVSADENPKHKTSAGNETTDKIFILSIDEAVRYLEPSERKASPTDYATAKGALSSSAKTPLCWWLLRTPGSSASLVAYVDVNGFISNDGTYTQVVNNTVRPVFWIDVNTYKSVVKAEKAEEEAAKAAAEAEKNKTPSPETETPAPDVTAEPLETAAP